MYNKISSNNIFQIHSYVHNSCICMYIYIYIHSIYNVKFNEGNKCAWINFVISKNSLEDHFYAYILFGKSSINYVPKLSPPYFHYQNFILSIHIAIHIYIYTYIKQLI